MEVINITRIAWEKNMGFIFNIVDMGMYPPSWQYKLVGVAAVIVSVVLVVIVTAAACIGRKVGWKGA